MRDKILGFAALALASAMAALGAGAEAQELSTAVQRTEGATVGAAIVHPARWSVEREPYAFGDTRGYTLWHPDTGAAHDHGGKPALRVALAYELEPESIEAEVDEIVADYPDLPLGRETVDVAREHEGVSVGPIPGSTPFTRVYVPVNGRVYSINVYSEEPGGEGLDADDRRLLSEVRFEQPSRSAGAPGLPGANSSEALYPSGAEARAMLAQEDAKAPAGFAFPKSSSFGRRGAAKGGGAKGGEERIAGGCWRAGPGFYVQTQHGHKANSSSEDKIPTGWSRIGLPNFWGQYTHGDLGYGRCTRPYYANDKYAVDYPLDRGDWVYAPFKCGRVTYAGRNQTHADYGIFVSIKACNGKYVNLTAHLSAIGINNGEKLREGARVTENTVIGYAGDTGGSIPVGRVHIHTAFYRYPEANPDGSPYGGAGLRVTRNRYVGTAAHRKGIDVGSRVYNYKKISPKNAFCSELSRCGERYLVSN